MKKYFFIAFIPSLAYAVVRYNIFKEVPWGNLPLWVSNKAFAMTATILVAYSFCADKSKPRKEIGILGFYIAIIHAIISLIILNPSYFAKFFSADGKLNFTGELSMLAGILSFSLLLIAVYKSYPAVTEEAEVDLNSIRQLVLWGILLNLVHLSVMGLPVWLKVADWPGMLPPITLVSGIISIIFIANRFLRSKNKNE